MDAKSLASLFREAVAFDLKKNKITSYAQVRREAEAFYTLLNREAFEAMLSDYLTSDNQLMDIFLDLHDAGLGVQKLAEKAFQESPRLIIGQFITQPKYAYHQNDVGKVYMAVNTWLCFFGAPTVTPEWTKCPLCGGAIKSTGNRTCSTCKKSSAEFVNIMAELSMMLETERSGKTTPTPAYWDLIKPGSEFHVEYKLEIENRRSQRTFEQHEEDLQALSEALYEAEKTINSFYAKVDLESGKDKPDFDALMRELIKSKEIAEASKLHNEEFTKKLSALKKYIEEKKKAYLTQREQNAQAQTFHSAVKSFLESLANLENDLTAHALTLYRFKTLFDSLCRTYTKIMAMLSNGFEITEPESKKALERFDKVVRDQAKAYLTTLEQGQKVDEQQKKLLTKVSELLNAFNGVTGADHQSVELTERFMNEIENAEAFQAYRVAQPAKYNELVAPIRDKLSELIQAEKQVLLDALEKKINALLEAVNSAKPDGNNAEIYKKQLESFKRDKQYDAFKKHQIYVDGVKRISDAIAVLKQREEAYGAQQLLDSFEKKVNGIVMNIESSSEKGTQSEFYTRQLQALGREQYYESLKSHGAYQRGIQRINEAIDRLKHREQDYKRLEAQRVAREDQLHKQKMKKLLVILAIVGGIVLIVVGLLIIFMSSFSATTSASTSLIAQPLKLADALPNLSNILMRVFRL